MSRIGIVTGAGGDIGKATALALARNGVLVVLTDIDQDGLRSTVEDIELEGGRAIAEQLDVTDREQILDLAGRTIADIGPVGILVNGAGALRPTQVENIPETEWDRIVDVNLKGTFLCSQAVLASMRDEGWGRIVNISSTAGKNVSTVGGAHYTASKAGVLGFTRHLASEVARNGITVNAVCPGLIETRMIWKTISRERMDEYGRSFPIPRLGQPPEVAALIRFLASDDAAYITGAALDINGGDLMV